MTTSPANPVIEEIMRGAKALIDRNPACHDWDHTLRVLHNARHICQVEGANTFVVEAAAVLHDIGRPAELADQGKTCHAAHGAGLAAAMLRDLGVTEPVLVEQIADCVRTHRYRTRGARRPDSLEAKIIFDADKLDCIGAIGIGRSFHFAGRIGARVHNAEREATAAESYSTEDSAYREFLVKLRFVKDRMLTAEGRRMAASRHEFMLRFFERLNREVVGHDFITET